MDGESLEHLERIETLLASVASLPWLDNEDVERSRADLLDFDANHWAIVRILSLPLYSELQQLLATGLADGVGQERPRIAVVLPVYGGQRAFLKAALSSLRRQVGVAIECWISIDGRSEDAALAEDVLHELGAMDPQPDWRVHLINSTQNEGVGRCRNRALSQIQTAYFTCLDADDVFHPLRCLHAWLLLEQLGVERLNTGWSRVSLREGKIVMINGALCSQGHNSFIARTRILQQYGYFADLRVHEDTEYQQRLQYFGAKLNTTTVVGHYLHSEASPDYRSLSTPLRRDVQAIHGHPYLCGTVIAAADEERREIDRDYQQLYGRLIAQALTNAFPGVS